MSLSLDSHWARRRAVRLIAVIGSAVTAMLVAANLHSSARPLVVLLFSTTVPGFAVVGFLELRDLAFEASLSVALSLSLTMGAAQAMVWAHRWNPDNAMAGLAGASLIVLIVQEANARRLWRDRGTSRRRALDSVDMEPT
jgi:hypothetical protein